MSLIPYAQFYRRHGVRRLAEFATPKLSPLDQLTLPRDSILHYLPQDHGDTGIAYDDIILNGVEKMPMVEHLTDLAERQGPPRPTQALPERLMRDYHRRYRRLRPLRKLDAVLKDNRTLIIENYALLQHTWRYTTSFFSAYYKWRNIQATLWENVTRLAKETDRQQYIRCFLPKQLPSLVDLKKAEQHIDRNSLGAFTHPNSLMILDIWTWLGSQRTATPMGRLGTEDAKKVNLIWVEGGHWFVLNLGLLMEWLADSQLDVVTGFEALVPQRERNADYRALKVALEGEHDLIRREQVSLEGQSTDSYNLQRRFLRALMTLFETKTLVGDLSPSVTDATDTPLPVDRDGELDWESPGEPKVDEIPAFQGGMDDDELEADLRQLEQLTTHGVEVRPTQVASTYEEAVIARCDELADQGLLSGAEYRRLVKLAGKYKSLPNPYGAGTLETFSQIDPDDLHLPDQVTLPLNDTIATIDPSFQHSSLLDFDRRYIQQVMKKDIVNAVLSVQRAGVAVTGYSVETIADATGAYEAHTLRLTPTVGTATTIRFRVPVVDENGVFRVNGVAYKLRKQRADMPIRKISPTRVALTSYHSKLFVDRSMRTVNNYAKWLQNQVRLVGLNKEDDRITALRLGSLLQHTDPVPYVYGVLGETFRSFQVGEYTFNFEYGRRQQHFGEEVVATIESKGLVVIGTTSDGLLAIDQDNTFYRVTSKEPDDPVVLGKIHDLLPLDPAKAPLEVAEVKIFNKNLPLGLMLGYRLGLEGLLRTLRAQYRRVPQGERVVLGKDEYVLRFSDESLVFSREDRLTTLVMAGFDLYQKIIRNYSVHDFDRRDVYFNVLEANGIGSHYVREIDMLYSMFVDPITEDLLREMGEPTDLTGLLQRAAELLLTTHHPREVDMEYMRIRGYERMAGAVYGEMVKAVRGYRSRPNSPNSKVEMNPQAVWLTIMQDPSISLVEDINPIQNLKEQEVVTFTGTGGRSTRSMVKRSRVYTDSDVGVISEATVDSSNVGIISYLTADPNLSSLRGTTRRFDKEKDGTARALSTSALISPCADRDDPKRVNFISIQHSHGVSAVGYHAMPIGTGYESVIAHRTDDLFAHTAKQEGRVIEVSDHHIAIEYKDGTVKAIELGRRYGVSAGSTYPHTVITSLKEGQRVKPGDVVCYNTEFFTPDPTQPGSVIWKAGVLARCAIMDSTDTLEDSCAISESLANKLATQSVKTRDLVLSFNQSIRNLVKVGDEVDVESILCTIEDSITADLDLFDDDSIDTLRLLGSPTPKAKYRGTVERIEVFYNGDKEDMSESLRTLANASDRRLLKINRALRKGSINGRVDSSFRVDGNPLEIDSLVIRVYLNGLVPMGIGDKSVFSLQLKTIVGRVMSGVNESEDGVPIDAIFGLTSISNRIVNSAFLLGAANSLLKTVSRRAAEIYYES